MWLSISLSLWLHCALCSLFHFCALAFSFYLPCMRKKEFGTLFGATMKKQYVHIFLFHCICWAVNEVTKRARTHVYSKKCFFFGGCNLNLIRRATNLCLINSLPCSFFPTELLILYNYNGTRGSQKVIHSLHCKNSRIFSGNWAIHTLWEKTKQCNLWNVPSDAIVHIFVWKLI